ncbi:hypothetical protein OU995_08855 [Roseateles sp. SL47]|uniref:hypothetical protein n=1 Tax=Roseateles sp. SL47 TaxID=2995138 RepID=UPI00226F0522|nr:hypothetical protein [Roseateles sp. SL47]WAC74789.1 hypothetical protein OU995_08855 [Roseateles sp. SL47]
MKNFDARSVTHTREPAASDPAARTPRRAATPAPTFEDAVNGSARVMSQALTLQALYSGTVQRETSGEKEPSKDEDDQDKREEPARQLTLFFNGQDHFDLLVPSSRSSDVTMGPREYYRRIKIIGDGACMYSACLKSPVVRRAIAQKALGGVIDPNRVDLQQLRSIIAQTLNQEEFRRRIVTAIQGIAAALRNGNEPIGAPPQIISAILSKTGNSSEPLDEHEAEQLYGQLVDAYINAVEFSQEMWGGQLELSALSSTLGIDIQIIEPVEQGEGPAHWRATTIGNGRAPRVSPNTVNNEFIPFASTEGIITEDGEDPEQFLAFFAEGRSLKESNQGEQAERTPQKLDVPPSKRSSPRTSYPSTSRIRTLSDLPPGGSTSSPQGYQVFVPPGKTLVNGGSQTSGSTTGPVVRRDGYTVFVPHNRELQPPSTSHTSSSGLIRRDGYQVVVPPGRHLNTAPSLSTTDDGRGIIRRDGYTIFPPSNWATSTQDQESVETPKAPSNIRGLKDLLPKPSRTEERDPGRFGHDTSRGGGNGAQPRDGGSTTLTETEHPKDSRSIARLFGLGGDDPSSSHTKANSDDEAVHGQANTQVLHLSPPSSTSLSPVEPQGDKEGSAPHDLTIGPSEPLDLIVPQPEQQSQLQSQLQSEGQPGEQQEKEPEEQLEKEQEPKTEQPPEVQVALPNQGSWEERRREELRLERLARQKEELQRKANAERAIRTIKYYIDMIQRMLFSGRYGDDYESLVRLLSKVKEPLSHLYNYGAADASVQKIKEYITALVTRELAQIIHNRAEGQRTGGEDGVWTGDINEILLTAWILDHEAHGMSASNAAQVARGIIAHNGKTSGGGTNFKYEGHTVFHISHGKNGKADGCTVFFIVTKNGVCIVGIGAHAGSSSYTLDWTVGDWNGGKKVIQL